MQGTQTTVNNTDNPAKAGSYVVAYLTGTGRLDIPVATGGGASSDPLSRPRATVAVTIGSQPAEIAFAGLTPSFVGLTQVNLRIPNLAAGTILS